MKLSKTWYMKFALLVVLCCVPSVVLCSMVLAAWRAYERPHLINAAIARGEYHAD
jgi:hypothetical protein